MTTANTDVRLQEPLHAGMAKKVPRGYLEEGCEPELFDTPIMIAALHFFAGNWKGITCKIRIEIAIARALGEALHCSMPINYTTERNKYANLMAGDDGDDGDPLSV